MLELILIMETRASNKSDYMYIKSTLDYFYGTRTFAITPIYAKTKSQLIQQDVKIKKAIQDSKRKTIVIVCADVDREEELNSNIAAYCKNKAYELVWMNLDVEDVYWGKQVNKGQKASEAIKFQKHKKELFPNMNNLSNNNPLSHRKTSNILIVFDKYLNRIET